MARNRNSKGKKPVQKRLGFFLANQEWFVPLSDGLLNSDAFQALSPTARDILIYWLRAYRDASSFDIEPLPDGMTFTYSQCPLPMAEETFNKGRKQIREHGFFDAPREIQPLVPGEPIRFTPSRRWEQFKAPSLETRKAKKSVRVKKKRARRTEMRTRE